MLKIILMVIVSFSIQVCRASDADGQYMVAGEGNDSCGLFIQATERGRNQSDWREWNKFNSWFSGYITAMNYTTNGLSDVLAGTDRLGAQFWLYNWCKEHPLNRYSNATEALMYELRNNNPAPTR